MSVESHVFHHYDESTPKVKIKLEKNSKGYNWEISLEGLEAGIVIANIARINEDMRKLYGEPTA